MVVVGARVVVGPSVTEVVGASVDALVDAVVEVVVGARVVVGPSVTDVVGASVDSVDEVVGSRVGDSVGMRVEDVVVGISVTEVVGASVEA